MSAERNVVHDIREALGLEADLVLWRNTTGQVVDHRGREPRTIRYGLAVGSADLVGIGPGGRFFALECKGAGGRLTVEQIQWIDLVRKFGGFATVVCSVEEAKGALARARRGEVQ